MGKTVGLKLLLWGRSAKTRRLCQIADAARDSKDWVTACNYYRRALESTPDAFHIWVQLGHAAKEMQNFGTALEAYREAERLNPDDIDLKIQLGHFYKMLNRHQEALSYYKSAIMSGSSDVHALHYVSLNGSVAETTQPATAQDVRERADAARDAGDIELAARLYLETIQIGGEDARIFVQLGNCLKDLGRFDASEKQYARAVELRPTDADCYLQLGHLMKLAGKPRQAADYYSKADELEPTRPDARIELERLRAAQTAFRPAAVPLMPRAHLEFDIEDLSDISMAILNHYKDALARRRH